MSTKKFGILAVVLVAFTAIASAQGNSFKSPVKGWHLMDNQKDGFNGISLDKAYQFVQSKNLKSKTVIVAIIDSGVDTLHEDLKGILWTNPKEIPGNGIDDDNNGYVDDVHGWNFLGGKDGRNVKEDSYEGARVYHKFKPLYDGKQPDTAAMNAAEKEQYRMWLKAKDNIIGGQEGGDVADLVFLKKALDATLKSDTLLQGILGKKEYTGKEADEFIPKTPEQTRAKNVFLYLYKATGSDLETPNKEVTEGFQEYVTSLERKKDAADKAPQNYRADIVKDNEEDINDRFYGNNDIMAGTPLHGTHVSGIIGAVRKNGKGIDGIADNVRIMMIRAVPDGDEHDKDIALAIRYAADNGAKIINMSFGKSFSPHKDWVDEAVKYAEGKGVLLVEAAGNSSANIDSSENYPNPRLRASKSTVSNWITVGASSFSKESGYTASFSNYGKANVDVFAPGVRIYSTVPGNAYLNEDGTSMASPVVAGTAAFLLSYFPNLSAQQVKYCIEKSAQAPTDMVKKPGTDQLVPLSDISRTGGFINAFEAAKIAASLNANEPNKKKLPTSTLKKEKKD
jgi:subtilisin family serine protease